MKYQRGRPKPKANDSKFRANQIMNKSKAQEEERLQSLMKLHDRKMGKGIKVAQKSRRL